MQINQIAWTRENTIGHSWYLDSNPIDQPENVLICHVCGMRVDHTEAFGAFDSILRVYSLGKRVLDIGGGQHDYNRDYLLEKYDVKLMVYDPFKRSLEHNRSILEEARSQPFDAVTSISVLNVISNKEALHEHISLARECVKEGGRVFFKVWPGNGSGVSTHLQAEGWQSNRRVATYVKDVEKVFGGKVTLDKVNQLIWAEK